MGDSGSETRVQRASSDGLSLEEKLQNEQQVKRYAKFLHSHIPLREAVQLNKRVNYFRGKKLIDLLLNDKIKDKNKPVCLSENEAKLVGVALLRAGLIHASTVEDKKKRQLAPLVGKQGMNFGPEGYYTWIYEGSKTMRNVLLGLMVFSITAMCMFPIWPQSAKIGIWYISVTLLIFLFILFTIRLILYIVCWSVGYEFWILPNFFDEDLGVVDSFIPAYSFCKATDLKDSWYFRAAGFVMLLAFGYWCSQQPTEFDEIYAAQMEFLSELYDGKLLSDVKEEEIKAQAIPDLSELEKQVEEDALQPEEEEEEISAEEEEAKLEAMMKEDEEAEAREDEEEISAEEEEAKLEAMMKE
eukprot:CAMPEP_0203747016 /NCGR_PEP_ID=MMETSP0098-20131031/2278_1 /ASSEMBLY_ACC=CAM_ASM_000208 /TAXON_ID=96639 /ORGANISM=" , Strain NY0313808BC1" /LENGTH=355 /DNA_ID=CAMNT_0050635297 /DNA_START=102 /DNA_END=1166 /DNA_ORIENTATION=+